MAANEPQSDVIQTLVAEQQRFLAFLTPRVGSPDEARELLQAAFVRGLEHADDLDDADDAVAWFYRVLRNALIDRHRHQATRERALGALAAELGSSTDRHAELEATVCACVESLTSTLKPEYAEVIRAVDLGGRRITEFADAQGITPNNATVRLHRARAALGRRLLDLCGTCCRHGCQDCECGSSKGRV